MQSNHTNSFLVAAAVAVADSKLHQAQWARLRPCKLSKCLQAARVEILKVETVKMHSSEWLWDKQVNYLISNLLKALFKTEQARSPQFKRRERWHSRCECSQPRSIMQSLNYGQGICNLKAAAQAVFLA